MHQICVASTQKTKGRLAGGETPPRSRRGAGSQNKRGTYHRDTFADILIDRHTRVGGLVYWTGHVVGCRWGRGVSYAGNGTIHRVQRLHEKISPVSVIPKPGTIAPYNRVDTWWPLCEARSQYHCLVSVIGQWRRVILRMRNTRFQTTGLHARLCHEWLQIIHCARRQRPSGQARPVHDMNYAILLDVLMLWWRNK